MCYMKEETGIKILIGGKEALERVHNATGIKRIAITTRLMEWFDDQDQSLQAIIMGQVAPPDQLGLLDMIKDRIEAEKANSSADHALDAHKEHERKPKKRTRSKGA